MKKGIAIFQIVYEGSGNITAQLLNANASPVENLVNTTGPLNGKQSAAADTGAYSISVTATGVWTIYVTQPVPIVVPYVPRVFGGNNLDVTDFFQVGQSTMQVIITDSGSGTFKATLLSAAGEVVSTFADAPAPYSATIDVPVQTGVPYLIDVEAVGPWQILLQ